MNFQRPQEKTQNLRHTYLHNQETHKMLNYTILDTQSTCRIKKEKYRLNKMKITFFKS